MVVADGDVVIPGCGIDVVDLNEPGAGRWGVQITPLIGFASEEAIAIEQSILCFYVELVIVVRLHVLALLLADTALSVGSGQMPAPPTILAETRSEAIRNLVSGPWLVLTMERDSVSSGHTTPGIGW